MDIYVADLLKKNGIVSSIGALRDLQGGDLIKSKFSNLASGEPSQAFLSCEVEIGGLPSDNLGGPELPENHHSQGR